MPQMAPYNWLNLFLLFTFILLYLISFIYFNKIFKYNHSKTPSKKFFPWKW